MAAFKRLSLALFLLFYVASATVATHHRAKWIAHRAAHASVQSSHSQFTEWKSTEDSFPNYREAKKKVGLDWNGPGPAICSLAPELRINQFHVFVSQFEITHSKSRRAVRAPPITV